MGVRWLLLKDLTLLRRSPLQAALLVAYPILIALLIGFAISRDDDAPRVAFLNEIPADSRIVAGGAELPTVGVEQRVCEELECLPVDDRAEAEKLIREGEALAALILPADLVVRLNSLATARPRPPEVEVIVNERDPLEAQVVDDRIETLLARANVILAQVVGASRLGDSPLVDLLTQPIVVRKQSISAPVAALDLFAVAVAAALTLTFVTLLLVAGSLALEREEGTFARLAGGLVPRWTLLAEKVGLGVAVGVAVTLLMLAGVQLFIGLHWGRIGLWLAAIVAGAAALGATGAALGAAARDVRAVSLLAFMASLPLALLSLVPEGAVGGALGDAVAVATALFPFDPTLDALVAALDPDGAGLGGPLLHLAALTVAYGALARLALRRFAAVESG